MNPNQEADIEDLFKRINKSIQRNDKSRIVEEDLNRVRAYVVQSKFLEQQLPSFGKIALIFKLLNIFVTTIFVLKARDPCRLFVSLRKSGRRGRQSRTSALRRRR